MKFSYYFHTLRYLKLSQIYWRLYYKLFSTPKADFSPPPLLRKLVGSWIQPIAKDIKMIGPRKFNFLNKEYELQSSKDWNNKEHAKLWLYNLHYFDDLNCKQANTRQQWHKELIQTWINDNPPGVGNGWEPYPISLRIVNWIKWGLAGNVLAEPVLHSLAVQARYLMQRIEYHLLANHIFANAKALIYAGLFFAGEEANLWFKQGVEILTQQLPEQVLADGGNFELSPMYHAIFLEDLLDIINIYNCYNISVAAVIQHAAKAMHSWLQSMTHPNGEPGFFNDTANGIAATTKELTKYYQELGLLVDLPPPISLLTNSGYCRVEKVEFAAILDLAALGPDYIPGHAHADSLSFECSLFQQKLIVNSGTSLYGTSAERLRQRGTAAHSTLIIDGKDSSEVWGGFRVARRARVFNVKMQQTADLITVSASHNGYMRLAGKPIHNREWRVTEKQLEVIDYVNGKGVHTIEVCYHLAPNVQVIDYGNDLVNLLLGERKVRMRFRGTGEVVLKPSTYHPEFGLSIENKKIIWLQNACKLPFACRMNLSW